VTLSLDSGEWHAKRKQVGGAAQASFPDRERKMMKIERYQLYLILAGIVIGLVLSIVALDAFWTESLLVNEPLHAALEAAGGLAAIVIALLLILKKREEYGGKFFLLGMGFLGMGLLDVFHSASLPGHGFVLLRSVASFVGAFWFALTWLPWCASERDAAWKRWTPWAVVIGAILFGVWTLAARETLPIMVQAQTFTTTAVTFHLLSGVFFIAAAIRLLIDFGRIGRPEIYLFACMATLFGLADLIFPVSALWDNTWWFWHLLRLISYVLALGFVIHEHQQTISDLRVALAERERAQSWFQSLIDTTQDAVVSIDRESRIGLFNPAAERIFGYSKTEVRGQKIAILMVEPHASEHDGYIARYERTGERRAIGRIRTVAARRKSGEVFSAELSLTEVAGHGSENIRYVAFIRDISEKARLQEQAIESERLAAIGATAARLAHEIGNPLNGMYMITQLLERRLARYGDVLEESVSTPLRDLAKEISRLNQLLVEFRSLSRREKYSFRPTALAAVVAEILEIEASYYTALGIHVEQAFPKDLPLIMADSEKLKQAVLNLCKNAVEAMPDGGTLTLRGQNFGEQVVLAVMDTGLGIPDGVDIFEPFATTKTWGSGLGLVIVRQIVAAHGGTITYTSERGKGTAFRLTLPVRPSPTSTL